MGLVNYFLFQIWEKLKLINLVDSRNFGNYLILNFMDYT